ncbi:microtubule associated protein-domain-containing protein [Yarrowia lipolytica]|uniref:YALI0F15763p n=2 Tax=Yarrowia lipolytica TaxID=4952 RepID=Q6C1J4_YARLI|nr:YALI0F15763p [Yarrowia lipolytica CLIB122]AOW07241.1 hypothetical protein YALI1_F21224g [Yarrowia lipolytica]KAB8286320.1 microtubule associated protein-domain-containing protein [Yarrowia lipolytica]KAE8174219.1 microtubule associated protein-domain-containing protein [Yarrowia lipolytica]KAJ8055656.1 microtubule associated protein-domain-containing protein [Yarrowia lipolytica]RDW24526.1 microtubule associated protein-domain-containing protein [Yarrowia lipolytica]|eukprot:XP_505468.1 YALI0F15763p [Yarrowia lipolytica CLIB122]
MKRRTSYLQNELERLSNELQLVFSDVGFSHAEKEEKERLHFQKLVEALQIRLLEEKSYRDELKQKCVDKQIRLKVLKTTSLPDVAAGVTAASGLVAVIDEPILPPYKELLERLDRSGSKLEQVFEERCDIVRRVQNKLDYLDQVMGPDTHSNEDSWRVDLDGCVPPRLTLDVLKGVEDQLERRQEEYESRKSQIDFLATEINEHWSLLGVENNELDETIIHHRSVPLALTNAKITYLQDTLKELQLLREERQKTIETYKAEVEHLWSRLDEDEGVIGRFLGTVAGETAVVVEKWHEELLRMRQQKQAHLEVFIAEARDNLKSIWDALYYSEEQRHDFVPFYMTEDSSEALLEVHEKEIAAREAELTENEGILDLVKQHKQLVQDAKDLEESSRDPARLMGKSQRGDPGRLLREEQMRKQIARKMPRLLVSLKESLMEYEEEQGKPFLVFGKSYLQVMQQQEVAQTPRRRAAASVAQSASRSVSQSASRGGPPSVSRSVSATSAPRSAQASPTKTRNMTQPITRSAPRPGARPVTAGNDTTSIRGNLNSLRNPGRPSTVGASTSRTAASRILGSVPRMQPLQNISSNRINKPSTIPGPKRRSLNKKLTAAQVNHNLMGGQETPVRESTPMKDISALHAQRNVPVWERLSPKKAADTEPRSSPQRSPQKSPQRSPAKSLKTTNSPMVTIKSPVKEFAVPNQYIAPGSVSSTVTMSQSPKRSPKKYGQLDRFHIGCPEAEIRSVSGSSTTSTTSSVSVFSDSCDLPSSDEEDPEYAALMMQQRRQISRGLPKKRSDQPRLSVFNWDKDVF